MFVSIEPLRPLHRSEPIGICWFVLAGMTDLFSCASIELIWLIVENGLRCCINRCLSVISWSFILCWVVCQWLLAIGSAGKTTPGFLSTTLNCFFCNSWFSFILTMPPTPWVSWLFNALCSFGRRLWFSFATRPAQSASLWVGSTKVSHVVGIGSEMHVSLDKVAETDSPWNFAAFDTACNDGICWVTLCGFVGRWSLFRNISWRLLLGLPNPLENLKNQSRPQLRDLKNYESWCWNHLPPTIYSIW